MDYKMETLNLKDYEDCLHFLKYSFDQYGYWKDFDKELPKVFRPRQELMEENLVIRDKGELVGLVGTYEMTLHVGNRTISVATIGNVATRPDCRGKGIMQTLFTESVRRADEKGIAVTRLGGKRQRYNRYGYDYAGVGFDYCFNLRNAAALGDIKHYHFLPLRDSGFAEEALALHQARPFHVDRIDAETFLLVLEAHSNVPFAVVDESNAFAGFGTAKANQEFITELCLVQPEESGSVAASWLQEYGKEAITVYCKNGDEENYTLSRYGESCKVYCPSMFRIHDWCAFTEPFLQYRHSIAPFPDGNLVLEITDEGRYELAVWGDRATFERTEKEPELTLDHLMATRLLFGEKAPENVVSCDRELMGRLKTYLPLPLTWSQQDNV